MGYETVAWLLTLIAGILVVTLPRKWALIPLLTVSILIPPAVQIVAAGLHFPLTRVLLLFGYVRMLVNPQTRRGRLSTIDRAMLAWVVTAIVTHTLLWQTADALINRLGFAFDALGTYFLAKNFVRDIGDMRRIVRVLALIAVALASAMLVERFTGRNAFYVFGGVPQQTEVREGRLRCQGPFLHPIMAGSFGAAVFPLAISLSWGTRRTRSLGVVSAVAATVITVLSSSSGPAFAYIVGIVGLCSWTVRRHMRLIRWGMLSTVVFLQVVMKAPVWSLIGRVKIFSGSTSYHREILIDEFINRFGEWWLLGTKSTQNWTARFLVPSDITNQFLRVAADGGFFSMILFIRVIVLCFRGLGHTRRAFQGDLATQKLVWALGVSLLVNVAAFMGCSYWDQVIVQWYTLLGLISRMSALSPVSRPAKPEKIISTGTNLEEPVPAFGFAGLV